MYVQYKKGLKIKYKIGVLFKKKKKSVLNISRVHKLQHLLAKVAKNIEVPVVQIHVSQTELKNVCRVQGYLTFSCSVVTSANLIFQFTTCKYFVLVKRFLFLSNKIYYSDPQFSYTSRCDPRYLPKLSCDLSLFLFVQNFICL